MQAPEADPKLTDCPALTAIRVVSGKWKTRVLWLLRGGPMHFGALAAALPGVSAKVLAEQLRQMRAAGLIDRTDVAEGGVTYAVYGFSAYGRSLIPVLDGLGAWGLAHEAQAGGVGEDPS